MPARFFRVSWLALGLVATAGWFITATRLTRLWGLHGAAPAIGLLAATAVAVTLWRLARTDREQSSLAALRCPRCRDALEFRHEHARPGGIAAGTQHWSCAGCGFDHSEALTCPECAA